MFKVQQYLDSLPKLLGTDKKEQEKPKTHQEMVQQAKAKGLRTPKYFNH